MPEQKQTSEIRDFTNVVLALGFSLSLLVYSGLFSGLIWPCDLACHFRIQYFIALLPLVIYALVVKRFKSAAIMFSAFMVNIVVITPLFFNFTTPALSTSKNLELKVIQLNLNNANQQFEAVRACITKADPDVVCLQEVNPVWQKYFRENLKNYPYQYAVARQDPFGVAILSRTELTDTKIIDFKSGFPTPTLTGNMTIGNEKVTVICTHPYPPVSPYGYNWRNRQMAHIAAFTSALKNTVLLCGDLNATRWSSSLIDLLQDGNLRDSSNGFGVQPTWPANCFMLWIPIDQILVSNNVVTMERKILADVGSDHYPVLVRLAFPQSTAPASDKIEYTKPVE